MRDKIIEINSFKTKEKDERKKNFSKKMANIISYQENVNLQDEKQKCLLA